jgi:hypothetical protein
MAYTININYFNTFLLENDEETWYIEESRIKGGYNETSVDLGVKAYTTNEDYKETRRGNALTYSGIYNSRTGVNETNYFSPAENTTKALTDIDGTIQKLYAEDTNLIVFQEDKVSRILADKDAIYSAEGGGTVTSSQAVLGQTVPYAGKYGISNNPESFAIFGTRKYFTDKNRGLVLRLSQDGITPISDYGMRDYFKDHLRTSSALHGMYDTHSQNYVLSMHGSWGDDDSSYKTVTYDEIVKGWTSFHSYKPTFGESLNNKFYTVHKQNLWEHYANSVTRNWFYKEREESNEEVISPSYVEFVANGNPSAMKTFNSINYEGTAGWSMESNITSASDKSFAVPKNGTTYTDWDGSTKEIGFIKKDDKYFSYLKNNSTSKKGEIIFGGQTSGIKGFFTTVKIKCEGSEARGAMELFKVSHDVVTSAR